MKWKHFIMENGFNMKGKIPFWFKKIEQEVLKDSVTREIKSKVKKLRKMK